MAGKVYDKGRGRGDKHCPRKTIMAKTNRSILALVISSSGAFQDGLLALMTTIPSISAVLVAEDADSAMRMVRNHQPALIILDLSSLREQNVILELKTQWPDLHLIVLVDNITQQEETEASGADRALIKGFPAQKLITIVEDIIEYREGSPLALRDEARQVLG
jgi:DNA-binding NarL/FixJ family response regulator